MAEEKRPEWMTSITSIVDPQDYLLGRKIDKTFELSQKERIEKAREERIELISKDKIKLSDDPILDLERRRRQLKMELIQNPVLLKQFRDKLLRGDFKNKIGQPSQTANDITPKHEPTVDIDNSKLNSDLDGKTKSVDRKSHRRSEDRHGSSSRHSKTRPEGYNHHHHRDPYHDRHERSGSSRRLESDKESKHSHRTSDRHHHNQDRKHERRHIESDRRHKSKSPSRHHRRRSRSPRSPR